ncbi:hypothetical protein CB1_001005007 [Camelus ferus]|nr:hypothetical protein CB1_001005007 [Camelus ferus]
MKCQKSVSQWPWILFVTKVAMLDAGLILQGTPHSTFSHDLLQNPLRVAQQPVPQTAVCPYGILLLVPVDLDFISSFLPLRDI